MKQGDGPRVIILTASVDPEPVLELIKAGAKGYLLKSEDPALIVDGIRVVMGGKNWLSPVAAEMVAGSLAEQDLNGEGCNLTPRELEILQWLGKGQTAEQIGEALFISKRTVYFHIEQILNKLNVHSKMEAFAIAVKNGWIQI